MAMISRRRFVGAGLAVAAAAAMPLPGVSLFVGKAGAAQLFNGVLPTTGTGGSQAVNPFSSAAMFKPFLHTPFQGRFGRNAGTLELTQVDDLAGTVKEATAGAQFSLLFDGSKVAKFSQGTYTLQHASLGSFAVFLVPVGKSGVVYQAVINRRTH